MRPPRCLLFPFVWAALRVRDAALTPPRKRANSPSARSRGKSGREIYRTCEEDLSQKQEEVHSPFSPPGESCTSARVRFPNDNAGNLSPAANKTRVINHCQKNLLMASPRALRFPISIPEVSSNRSLGETRGGFPLAEGRGGGKEWGMLALPIHVMLRRKYCLTREPEGLPLSVSY